MFVSLLTDDGKVPEIRFIPKFLDTQSEGLAAEEEQML